MSLTKKAQWIVWDGRKHGIDAETILARCEEKGVTDSRDDLMKAITARAYKAQPQRSKVYEAVQVNPVEALVAKMTQAGLTAEEQEPILAIAREKQAAKQAEQKQAQIAQFLAAAQAI